MVATMKAIEIRDLTKKYHQVTAVDDVSLSIEQGTIFGLLGPNGAGKTTIISMLSTLLKPTLGSASVWGHDITTEKDEVRRAIGIIFQDPSLDDELTGRENMDFHGRLYRIDTTRREKRIDELVKLVELEDRIDDLVKTYSGGMKRRLEIARSLMHRPHVLFLDEPTLGLDPQTRRRLWTYIKQFSKEEAITIILTTHYMEEADFLCDQVSIIDHGRIITSGTPEELKAVLGGDLITLEVSKPLKLKKILEKNLSIRKVKRFDNNLSVVVNEGGKTIPKIIDISHDNDITVKSVVLKQPSLEDVFIHYTGRRIRDAHADEKERLRRRFGWGRG
jgi:ABC-2 type transport system ATP-binding protein